jgi:transposase InsO family protein
MPWKEHRTMDLRNEFVLVATSPGANLSQLCREFGISRTNGYKWLRRFKAEGEAGLEDRSRRPKTISGTDGEVVLRVIELRRRYSRWGAKKIRQLLLRSNRPDETPSAKTIARILDRAGEPRVRKPKRRLRVVLREHQPLVANAPNDVWTVDFKGWWRTKDGKRFEPLTVRDAFSRYILCLKMLSSTRAAIVKPAFEQLFERCGLPHVIRVDNGSPFACTSAPAGLSQLSAWWTSLGIRVSFSRPAHPQDNGAHERMHFDVADQLEAEPADSLDVQQRAADRWRVEFNQVRPHEALGMRTPAQLYSRSPRRYRGIRPPRYPASYGVRRVNRNGCVHYMGKTVFITESLVGHDVAVRRTRRGRLAIRFYDLSLGLFDLAAAPPHHSPRFIPLNQLPSPKRATSA